MSLTAETTYTLIKQGGMPKNEISRLIGMLSEKKKKKNTGLLSDNEAKRMLIKKIRK